VPSSCRVHEEDVAPDIETLFHPALLIKETEMVAPVQILPLTEALICGTGAGGCKPEGIIKLI
jgi:hypothetical protein